MSTIQGEPPSPTFRSIFGGIIVAVLLFLAFMNLSTVLKYAGAVLGFIPGKLGLIQVVKPQEVIPVDVTTSPTVINIPQPGIYMLYTDNYDLLVINDAVVEAGSKPWLKIEGEDGEEIPVRLVERGLAIYDTIWAKGRPVAKFAIAKPGNYSIRHPSRPDEADIVPDYITGHENWIIFLFGLELAALIMIVLDIRRAIRSRRKKLRELRTSS
jgi:hypothetical protein